MFFSLARILHNYFLKYERDFKDFKDIIYSDITFDIGRLGVSIWSSTIHTDIMNADIHNGQSSVLKTISLTKKSKSSSVNIGLFNFLQTVS